MIFLNLLNRIFGHKKPLSRQEIEDYKKGTGDTHDIESKMSDSAFNAEAMEGWEKNGYSVKEAMISTDKKMEHFVKDSPKATPKNRSEEHTSELQSRPHLVCRLLLEKKKKKKQDTKMKT